VIGRVKEAVGHANRGLSVGWMIATGHEFGFGDASDGERGKGSVSATLLRNCHPGNGPSQGNRPRSH